MFFNVREIELVVRKFRLGEEPPDRADYLRLTGEERVAIVEQLRQEYHGWDYETEPRLQRVYRVLERG